MLPPSLTCSSAPLLFLFLLILGSTRKRLYLVIYFVCQCIASGPNPDFVNTSLPISFPPGESSIEVNVSIVDDQVAELSELFSVTILNPTISRVNISTATATVNITDDDSERLIVLEVDVVMCLMH